MSELIFTSKMYAPYMAEGDHACTITDTEMVNFKHGEPCLSVTFKNEEGQTLNQFFPIIGFRTWDEEETTKRTVADHLTQEEKDSQLYIVELDEKGQATNYVSQIFEMKGGKKVKVSPARRLQSATKSEAARTIIEKMGNAFGIEEGTSFKPSDLLADENGEPRKATVTVKLVSQPNGDKFNRAVKFKPLVEETADDLLG